MPLLIAVPLVLATPGMSGSASTATRQLGIGVAIGLSIAMGAAGWWLAGVLANPIARLKSGWTPIARGVRRWRWRRWSRRRQGDRPPPSRRWPPTSTSRWLLWNVPGTNTDVADKLQSALQVPLGSFPEIDVAVVVSLGE